MTLAEHYYFDAVKKITDKGFTHSFITEYYTHKFTNLKDNPLVLLEIGLYKGRSMELWRDWFTNAALYGIDKDIAAVDVIAHLPGVWGFNRDGYTSETVSIFGDSFFDIIIEDGPHTLDTQIFAVKNWSKKLKRGGTLIIEDIQSIDHVSTLVQNIPAEPGFNFNHMFFDYRPIKNRYDDILLEVTRL